MTTIIVTNEDNDIQEFDFDADTSVISIGRRSTNDVCIPNLSVSGKHARITIDTTGALIEDLNSTNGTYINGRLISRQLLESGDEIIIGKTRIQYKTPTAADSREPITKLTGNGSNSRVTAPVLTPPLSPSVDQSIDQLTSDSDELDFDEEPMTLSQKAKLALGGGRANPSNMQDDFEDADVALADHESPPAAKLAHPLDNIDDDEQKLTHDLDAPPNQTPASAVIEIKNGAKSGQVLPIDKPVTTLGRPGIQIAAIMRKPDGYFLMHIESDDSVDLPTLNLDEIGDEPVLLHSGDRLNVAGIEVEFMLS
jgi:pSer/pThr/pTyr-binding forkhead associated (FHA) protein